MSKNKNIYRLFALSFVVLTLVSGSVSAQKQPLKTVAKVDLDKYLGKWFEIARLPNSFQEKCVGEVSAEYTKNEDGTIRVTNACLEKDGKIQTVVGKAKIDDKKTNAKLKVRFAPAVLSWFSGVWGDYQIIALGDNYEYAVVGTPDRKYLWFLSRKPQIEEPLYQEMLKNADAQGFSVGKVVRTKQNVETVKGTSVTN